MNMNKPMKALDAAKLFCIAHPNLDALKVIRMIDDARAELSEAAAEKKALLAQAAHKFGTSASGAPDHTHTDFSRSQNVRPKTDSNQSVEVSPSEFLPFPNLRDDESTTVSGKEAKAINASIASMIKTINEAAAEKAELLDWLSVILPMAKGYAYANRVGANQEKIDGAEEAIAKHSATPKPEGESNGN